MTFPLISADWDIALWAALIAIAALGFWSESTTFGKRVSSVSIILVIAMLLSNFGVIPFTAPAYDVVWNFLVPAAVPLLLLKANLRRIIPETGPVLGTFILAVVGTLTGAIVGFYLLPLGPEGADLSGIFSATYIGGSMNFAAVAQALDFRQGALLTATLAADNVMGTLHILVVVLIPSAAILTRWIPSPIIDNSEESIHDESTPPGDVVPFNPTHITLAVAISLTVVAAGYSIAEFLGISSYGILFVTAIALIIANVFHNRLENLHGAFETGMLFMFVFFATIGAAADIRVMLETGILVFAYATIIITVHILVIILGAKLFKLDLAEVVVASLACVGGPVTPAAVAAAKGWHSLVTPGIMVGILGYAIANFIGVALASFLG